MASDSSKPSSRSSYKDAGVDVEAGDALVDWLSQKDPSDSSKKLPHAERIVSGIGGFASLFRIDFPEMAKPCIVTCTDGVGTKVKLASHFQKYDGVGQDLVAMCVNDLICTGGRPLIFLDYYATGELKLGGAKEFLTGVRNACFESDCALVGGETAEMPGVYQSGDFDCAGFAVGVVDEPKAWGPHRVRAGDVIVGASSSGFHSNGYSLLRKVFAQDLERWKDILLTPTALYVRLALEVGKQVQVAAAAHITGGGIENIPRVLPSHLQMKLKSWKIPEPFLEVERRASMNREELLQTLNCGLGFCFVVRPEDAPKVAEIIRRHGFTDIDVGEVTP